MVCADKSRLQDEWTSATNAYARLVAALTNHMGKLPRDEYTKEREAVEDARARSEKLRRSLDLHVVTHGC